MMRAGGPPADKEEGDDDGGVGYEGDCVGEEVEEDVEVEAPLLRRADSSRGFQEVMGMRKSRHSIMRPMLERIRRMRVRAAWWWPRK